MAFTERYVTQAAAGGGIGTEGDPWTLNECATSYIAGDRVNVKDDGVDYTPSTLTFATNATDSALVHIRGYSSTIGDGGKPTFDLSSTLLLTGEGITFESFNLTMDANDVVIESSGSNRLIQLDVTNTHVFASAIVGGPLDFIALCNVNVINVTVARTAINVGLSTHIIGCTVKTTKNAISASDYENLTVIGCILVGVGATAVVGITAGDLALASDYSLVCHGNTIYNFTDGIEFTEGQDIAGTAGSHNLTNNVIYDVDYGIRNSGGTKNARLSVHSNFIGNATTARYSGLGDTVLHNDVTLTADPFTDSANDDFTLNNTAGGGALVRDAGLEAPDPL